jgi:putative RecB family exonuclease
VAQVIERLCESVSPSRLALFQSCRLKFFFRQVLKITKRKTPALHLGSAVHTVLKAWNRARWQQQFPTLGGLYTAYEVAWALGQNEEPVNWDSPATEAEHKQVGWRLLETFFRETTICSDDKPEGVEVPVECDLSKYGLPRLVGVLDLVQDRCIVDFKTSASTPQAERAALIHGTQATAYALLYRENTGGRETGVEFHHLIKLKQPRLVVVALPPIGEREQSRLLRVIDAYVDGLQRRDFIPSPGMQCASCEFINECAAWPD